MRVVLTAEQHFCLAILALVLAASFGLRSMALAEPQEEVPASTVQECCCGKGGIVFDIPWLR